MNTNLETQTEMGLIRDKQRARREAQAALDAKIAQETQRAVDELRRELSGDPSQTITRLRELRSARLKDVKPGYGIVRDAVLDAWLDELEREAQLEAERWSHLHAEIAWLEAQRAKPAVLELPRDVSGVDDVLVLSSGPGAVVEIGGYRLRPGAVIPPSVWATIGDAVTAHVAAVSARGSREYGMWLIPSAASLSFHDVTAACPLDVIEQIGKAHRLAYRWRETLPESAAAWRALNKIVDQAPTEDRRSGGSERAMAAFWASSSGEVKVSA